MITNTNHKYLPTWLNNNLFLFISKFSPDLIIISSGYDSAIGDPKVGSYLFYLHN